MNRNNSRTLLVKAAGFLSVASLSVLISLPGLSQQSPANTSPSVPSTVKPTNPGSQDAGTTNGGENLNRVPSTDSSTQRNDNLPGGQNFGTPGNADSIPNPAPVNRVEGRDQGNVQNRTNSESSGSSGQSDVNQPGVTTGGDASQQVKPTNGSMQQRNRTTPRSGGQYRSQQRTPRSTTTTGVTTDRQSTTDSQTNTQQGSGNGSVRALW